LSPGHRVELGFLTLTEEEIVRFAEQWDPQWFHTDPVAAAGGHHGGVIASGIHTLAVLQRLCVEAIYTRWAVIAGRGFDRLRFTAPVRPGDTLTGSVQISDVSLDETRGRVQLEMEMRCRDGGTVLTASMTVYLWRRGHGPAAPTVPAARTAAGDGSGTGGPV
jgi:acyl dehydratase